MGGFGDVDLVNRDPNNINDHLKVCNICVFRVVGVKNDLLETFSFSPSKHLPRDSETYEPETGNA